MSRQTWFLSGAIAAYMLTGAFSPANAQEVDTSDLQTPLLLNADELRSEQEGDVVIAEGRVEVYQDDRILYADRIEYNKETAVVKATGNIVLVDKTGNIVYADEVELTDDLKYGFIEGIKVLLTDDSRIVAQSGEVGDNITSFSHAAYSPCEVCEDTPNSAPLWRIRAEKISHDKIEKDVTYRNARLEFLGIPVAYTPYLTHPDPTVERRSGILSPIFGQSSSLGTTVGSQYYFNIDETQDATVEARLMTRDGLLLGGEYRKSFDKGSFSIQGSTIYTDRERPNGTRTNDHFRGYLMSEAAYGLTDEWRLGSHIELASDDDYLRRYDYSDADILTSKIYGEYFSGRAYANVAALRFQDLRPDSATDDPIVLPYLEYSKYGEPADLWGGRWFVDSSAAFVLRDDEGTDSRRVSTELGWTRRFQSDFGLVSEVEAVTGLDAFFSSNVSTGSTTDDASNVRFLPQVQLTSQYPISKQFGENSVHYIEPIVSAVLAPNVGNSSTIANEDSLSLELDATNLFSRNKFPGRDRVETGSWVSYGVRTGINNYGEITNDPLDFSGGRTSLFIGQLYRFDESDNFSATSGLNDDFSDFVGYLEAQPNDSWNAYYSFRFNNENFDARRHEFTGTFTGNQFDLAAQYLFVDQSILPSGTEDREELSVAAGAQLSDQWSVLAQHKLDLTGSTRPLETSLSLSYEDECFTFTTVLKRDNTRRADVEERDSILFSLVFKHLGEVKSPTLRGELFDENSSSQTQ